MNELQRNKMQLDMQMKLANMQFYSFWRDSHRDTLQKHHLQNNPLVDITQLFYKLEGVGHCLGAPPSAAVESMSSPIVDQESSLSEEGSSMFKGFSGGGLSSAIAGNQEQQRTYCLGFKDVMSPEIQ